MQLRVALGHLVGDQAVVLGPTTSVGQRDPLQPPLELRVVARGPGEPRERRRLAELVHDLVEALEVGQELARCSRGR